MKNFFKGKFGTTLVVLATLLLAGVAIYTAIRLYQLRQEPVAPNVPSSFPQAATCSLEFSLEVVTTPTASPTGSPTTSPTGTPTATPTKTPVATPNSCGGTCGSNANCANGLICYQGFCRNNSCRTSTSCICTGTPAPTPTPTTPSLPQSGTDWPTYVGAGVGIFVIVGSLLLAL